MWKLVFASVAGTSHAHTNQECQDCATCSVVSSSLGDCLIAVCADGAGSSTWSREGALIASDAIVRSARDFVASGTRTSSELVSQFSEWITQARDRQIRAAHSLGVPLRELACTLLAAFLTDHWAAFFQIGDGAIVVDNGPDYDWVFWPQSGEYANTTYFLSDEGFEAEVLTRVIDDRPVNEIAVFTDGLERLVLIYADRKVHSPFLAPMLARLRAVDDGNRFIEPLRTFLNSDSINSRTDDDKTLILATRLHVSSE